MSETQAEPSCLQIAQLGQPVLRRKADPVPDNVFGTAELRQVVEAMLETLEETGGVGLAAPQVFLSRRLFLAAVAPPSEEHGLELDVFINPQLTPLGEDTEAGWEGCLSFSELTVLVPRCKSVRIEYQGVDGQRRVRELSGFPARVVQHENDHLDGILTIDRARSSLDIVKTSEMATVLRERGAISPAEKSGDPAVPLAGARSAASGPPPGAAATRDAGRPGEPTGEV